MTVTEMTEQLFNNEIYRLVFWRARPDGTKTVEEVTATSPSQCLHHAQKRWTVAPGTYVAEPLHKGGKAVTITVGGAE